MKALGLTFPDTLAVMQPVCMLYVPIEMARMHAAAVFESEIAASSSYPGPRRSSHPTQQRSPPSSPSRGGYALLLCTPAPLPEPPV